MRIARVDDNQKEIVKTLRKLGCAVFDTHILGMGFPDIVVSIAQKTFLVEIKDGSKWKSSQKLTPDQVEFHKNWKAKVYIISSVTEAIEFVNNVIRET